MKREELQKLKSRGNQRVDVDGRLFHFALTDAIQKNPYIPKDNQSVKSFPENEWLATVINATADSLSQSGQLKEYTDLEVYPTLRTYADVLGVDVIVVFTRNQPPIIVTLDVSLRDKGRPGRRKHTDVIAWEKGIYPNDKFSELETVRYPDEPPAAEFRKRTGEMIAQIILDKIKNPAKNFQLVAQKIAEQRQKIAEVGVLPSEEANL